MSEQEPSSNEEIVQAQPEERSETKEEFVARKAYEDVTRDMHKFKNQKKDLQAKVSEYETKMKALEEQKLVEQERYKELYEGEKKQREEREQAFSQKEQSYFDSLKKTALKGELGGIESTYLIHADLNSIEVLDDGTLSSESVREAANKFRQDHPMLVPSDGAGNITNAAPPSKRTVVQTKDKMLGEMSFDEKAALIASLKR